MAKLKLFHRSKTKENAHVVDIATKKETRESEEKQIKPETREKPSEAPIKEYNETLYSKESAQKQPIRPSLQKKQPLKRITWENAETIEHNIDSMRMIQTEVTKSGTQTKIATEKKVDFILLKKKSRP